MKRRALKLLLFLLAGAIINVGVAWACCLWPSDSNSSPVRRPTVAELNYWRARVPRHMTTPEIAIHRSGIGCEKLSLQARGVLRRAGPSTYFTYETRGVWLGLPTRSMYGGMHSVPVGTSTTWRSVDDWVLPVPDREGWLDGLHYLPHKPLWPGFAINTIFFAGILWMLFAVPGAVRRRVRITRGQCASCGYSLRGTPGIEKCPECGATA